MKRNMKRNMKRSTVIAKGDQDEPLFRKRDTTHGWNAGLQYVRSSYDEQASGATGNVLPGIFQGTPGGQVWRKGGEVLLKGKVQAI